MRLIVAKDFCFLFYFQNYAFGTRKMDRRHKGAYIDLLIEQADLFVSGKEYKMSLSYVKEVLSSDFDTWEKIKEKYRCEDGKYWNESLLEKQIARKSFTESRKNNRLGKTKKNNTSLSSDKHMVNINKDINKDKVKKIKYTENVKLTEKEYQSLLVSYFDGKEELLKKAIDKLDAYKESSGKTYKSDAGAIRSWVADKVKKEAEEYAKNGGHIGAMNLIAKLERESLNE